MEEPVILMHVRSISNRTLDDAGGSTYCLMRSLDYFVKSFTKVIFWIGQGGEKAGKESLVREVLLKGKPQYGWPPCTN